MFKKIEFFVLIYALLATLMNVSLLLLGESRVDAYVAVNVLMYFISYTVIKPFYETPLLVRLLNLLLLTAFSAIVALRLYEVLVP